MHTEQGTQDEGVELWRNSAGGYEIFPAGEGWQRMGCWATFLGTFSSEEEAIEEITE